MASQDAANLPGSKLAQMRMRFQQKTQAEQEQRRQELTQSVTAPSRATSTRLIGNGKVRQMFDERRRGAGIDRSNPLKPIGGTRASSVSLQQQQQQQQQQPQQQQQQQQQQQLMQITKGLSAMSLKENPVSGRHISNDTNNNNSSNSNINRNSSSNSNSNGNSINNKKLNSTGTMGSVNRLKPVITRKTPPKKEKPTSTRGFCSPPTSARSNIIQTAAPATEAAQTPVRAALSDRGYASSPKMRGIQVIPKSPVTKIQMDTQPPEDTKSCRFCGRHFNVERISKHEEVCQRTMKTKRKIFDASKQRFKGTDNEKYVKKAGLGRSQSTYSSAAQMHGLRTGIKKSNWRKKHEEFIEAIRAAKKVQAHLARGGKLSDLPPPPPSENPDYIQCPHCGRRFNQQAAERHIPRCATMEHNKPRKGNAQPAPKRR